jgi:hypothetical protein
LALPAIGHHPVLANQLHTAVEHRGGVRPAVRVDPDDEHLSSSALHVVARHGRQS